MAYAIIALIVAVIVNLIAAKMMDRAAALKGYGTDAHAFAMVFFLGIIGCIYVVALPDKIQQSQNQQIIEMLSGRGVADNEKM